MPPATIASAISSTRKTLRTDHSTRRPSMSVPLVAGGGSRCAVVVHRSMVAMAVMAVGRARIAGGSRWISRCRRYGMACVGISDLVNMTCVRIDGVLTVPGVWILSGARRRAVSCMTLKPLECRLQVAFGVDQEVGGDHDLFAFGEDRKSTRLNSSHVKISYAV